MAPALGNPAVDVSEGRRGRRGRHNHPSPPHLRAGSQRFLQVKLPHLLTGSPCEPSCRKVAAKKEGVNSLQDGLGSVPAPPLRVRGFAPAVGNAELHVPNRIIHRVCDTLPQTFSHMCLDPLLDFLHMLCFSSLTLGREKLSSRLCLMRLLSLMGSSRRPELGTILVLFST